MLAVRAILHTELYVGESIHIMHIGTVWFGDNSAIGKVSRVSDLLGLDRRHGAAAALMCL
jgi:hypothetical protein